MNETESLYATASQPFLEAIDQQTQEIPAAPVSPGMIARQMAVEQRHASVLPGLIGALLGSIPGIIFWVILGQIGFIAGICGWVMIQGAVFGYTKLSGGIDRRGRILATIVALLMPIVSEYLGIAVSVYRNFHESYGVTIAEAIGSVPLYLAEPDVLQGMFFSLILGYVFIASGFIRINPKTSKLEQSRIPRL